MDTTLEIMQDIPPTVITGGYTRKLTHKTIMNARISIRILIIEEKLVEYTLQTTQNEFGRLSISMTNIQ